MEQNRHTETTPSEPAASKQVLAQRFAAIGSLTKATLCKAGRAMKRPLCYIGRNIAAFFCSVGSLFKRFGLFVKNSWARPFVKIKNFGAELKQIQGFSNKCRRFGQVFHHQVKTKKASRFAGRFAVSFVLPVAACVCLIMIVSYYTNLEYAIAVTRGDQVIAYVKNEEDFNQAAALVEQQIVYVEDEQSVDLSAEFELAQVANPEEIVDQQTLANRLISSSDVEIAQATGIYIDGEFCGAIEDVEPLEQELQQMLADYQAQTGTENAEFINQIEMSEGLFLQDSMKDEAQLLELIHSEVQQEQVYTVQAGDTISGISSKNDITMAQLLSMNPEVPAEGPIYAGQELKLTEAMPFLQIKASKEISYQEEVNFEVITQQDSNAYKGSKVVKQAGQKGVNQVTATVELVNGKEVNRIITNVEQVSAPVNQIIMEGTKAVESSQVLSASVGSGSLSGISFIRPLPGGKGYVSQYYHGGHSGVDIAAPSGTPIYAAASGTVILAKWYSGYGKCVIIDHGNGVQTLYGHQSAIAVSVGQTVSQGQCIGYVGTTGQSTGNHLHLEVRSNGSRLNPSRYVPL